MPQDQFKKKRWVLPMSNLFDSIFNNATATVDPLRLLLALLVQPLSRDGPILDL